jgi:hypothetical protein
LLSAHFKLLSEGMNARKKIIIVMGISSLAALPLMAGPSVTIQVGVPPPPAVVVQAPVPAVTVVAVPDTYVWDGTEYVGVVGTQYYYLGPGNVWLTLDAGRMARWHDWEKAHADWRTHAIRNELYRHDAHEHVVPRPDDRSHDKDRDKDHDHDH